MDWCLPRRPRCPCSSSTSGGSAGRTIERRVDVLLGEHLHRRRTGVKHPVADFLFTYYSYRPAQLRRWHPGAGVVLADADPSDLGPEYVASGQGSTLDVSTVLERRGAGIAWIRDLLAATASRPPHFGCFGLHEWAMVYRQDPDEVRHRDWPLRLDPADCPGAEPRAV